MILWEYLFLANGSVLVCTSLVWWSGYNSDHGSTILKLRNLQFWSYFLCCSIHSVLLGSGVAPFSRQLLPPSSADVLQKNPKKIIQGRKRLLQTYKNQLWSSKLKKIQQRKNRESSIMKKKTGKETILRKEAIWGSLFKLKSSQKVRRTDDFLTAQKFQFLLNFVVPRTESYLCGFWEESCLAVCFEFREFETWSKTFLTGISNFYSTQNVWTYWLVKIFSSSCFHCCFKQ